MAPDDNSVQLQFEFPDNTGPLSTSWQGLADISKNIRDSWEAIQNEMDGTIEKADKLREALNLKDTVLDGIQQIVGQISSSINTNDATLKSSLQTIQQILNNSNNVNALLSRVDGYAPKNESGFSNPLSNPMAYAAYANQMRQMQSDPFYQRGSTQSQFADPNQRNFFENRTNILPLEEELGGHLGSNNTGRVRESFGLGAEDRNQPNEPEQPLHEANGITAADAAQSSMPNGPWNPPIPLPNGANGTINLSQYSNLAPYWTNSQGGQSNALKQALESGDYNAITAMALQGTVGSLNQSALGGIPGFGGSNGLFANLAGISNGIQQMGSGDANSMSSMQQKMLSALDSMVGALTKSSAAINAAGITAIGSNVWGALTNVQNLSLSKLAYPSQSIADMTGNTAQYNPLNPNSGPYYAAEAHAYALSHGGGTIYSSRDALTAMYAANQLGLTNNKNLAAGYDMTNYQNIDYQMQTQYGLSHGETQGLMSTALAYGINMNQFATGYGQARQAAYNAGGQGTNMAYVQQSYQLGAGTAASLGFNNSASVGFGNAAATFGAGNQIAQAAGLTGQELMGTTLGTALFAQQAGVSFMDTYAAAQNMGYAQAQKLQSNAMVGLLQNLGIPVNSIKKPSDLNAYAIKLGIILPQLGVTDVTTPQQAVVWAYGIIAQSRGQSAATTTSALNSYTAPGSNGNAPSSGTQGVPSTSTLLSQMTSDTSALGGSQSNSGISNTALSTSATTANGVTVQVQLAPGLQNIISATVQSATSAYTSSSANITQASANG